MVALLAATSLAVLCPRPAAAQQDGTWTFSDIYHAEDKKLNGVAQPIFDNDRSLTLSNSDTNAGRGVTDVMIAENGNASGSVLLKGQDSIIAIWTPPYSYSYSGASPSPAPKEPESVTVKIRQAVIGQFVPSGSHPEKVQFSSIQLNDGFDDPVVVTNDQAGYKEWVSSGLHLKTLSTVGGSWIQDWRYPNDSTKKVYRVVLPWDIKMLANLKASGTGYNPSDYDGPSPTGSLSAILWYPYIFGDSRTVQIGRARSSRPLLDANASTEDKARYDWIEADGTMHGHTRYSYEAQLDTAGYETYWNGQSFSASPSDSWSNPSNLNWSWNPTGGVVGNPYDNDSITGSLQQMPKGTPYKDVDDNWTGGSSPTGVTKTVAYSLTDTSDGAKATAKYVLTLHDEWDNKRPDPLEPYDVIDYYTRLSVNGNVIAPSGTQPFQENQLYDKEVPCAWNWSGTVGLSLSATLSGGFKVGDALNFGLNVTGGGNATATVGMAVTGSLPGRTWSYPEYHVHYHRNVYMFDHFVGSGCDGTYGQFEVPKFVEVGFTWAHPMRLGTSFPSS